MHGRIAQSGNSATEHFVLVADNPEDEAFLKAMNADPGNLASGRTLRIGNVLSDLSDGVKEVTLTSPAQIAWLLSR